MNHAKSQDPVKAFLMPEVDPWMMDVAYDESMCRSICEHHPHWVWMGTGDNWPIGADSKSLFVAWHPSSIMSAALKKGVDLTKAESGRAMSSTGLFRLGTLIGAIDSGKMMPVELEAMASLILPRTPPVGLRMEANGRDLWQGVGEAKRIKAFEAESKKRGVDFASDFAVARLPLSSQAIFCAGNEPEHGDFEQELADRVELFKCRAEAKLIANEAPESKGNKIRPSRSV